MKKLFSALLIVLSFSWSSCLKDYTLREVTYYKPVFKTTAEVRANIKSGDPELLSPPGQLFY
ncbi:MAG: hypothetical protein ACK5OP_12665 [Sphingobacteriales bacterium]